MRADHDMPTAVRGIHHLHVTTYCAYFPYPFACRSFGWQVPRNNLISACPPSLTPLSDPEMDPAHCPFPPVHKNIGGEGKECALRVHHLFPSLGMIPMGICAGSNPYAVNTFHGSATWIPGNVTPFGVGVSSYGS